MYCVCVCVYHIPYTNVQNMFNLPPNPSGTYVLRTILQKIVGSDKGLFPSFRREMCR